MYPLCLACTRISADGVVASCMNAGRAFGLRRDFIVQAAQELVSGTTIYQDIRYDGVCEDVFHTGSSAGMPPRIARHHTYIRDPEERHIRCRRGTVGKQSDLVRSEESSSGHKNDAHNRHNRNRCRQTHAGQRDRARRPATKHRVLACCR